MKEKKNIDRLYQEKFKDFEVTPEPKVWKNIANRLENEEQKKPIILPIWYKIAGVAAVLAIILSGGYFLDQNNFFGNKSGVVFEFEEIKRPEFNTSIENNTLTKTGELLEEIISENQQNKASNKGLIPVNNRLADSGEDFQKEKISEEIKPQENNTDENSAL
ncbi:MAG TPA: hypothetical protein VLO29_02160, partial [Salegentibacter sp.]|nr:hypothetical protein [Salegentibacter sp.]